MIHQHANHMTNSYFKAHICECLCVQLLAICMVVSGFVVLLNATFGACIHRFAQYFLGKVSHKLQATPSQSIAHYKRAAVLVGTPHIMPCCYASVVMRVHP
jgi:hypothetical protein